MQTIRDPARDIPVVENVEVLVLGGGPAGIHAAAAAARGGAKTMLVERYGFLGGMATAGLVGPILGVYHWGTGRRILGGIPWEMLQRMSDQGGALLHEKGFHVPFDPEVLRFAADKVVIEAGARLRLHSVAVDAVTEDGRITAVIIESKSGRQAIKAKVVVDSTGDGDIASRAGAPFELGRPEDGALQPFTLVFRLANVDLLKIKHIYDTKIGYVAADVRKLMLKAVQAGELPPFGGPWIMKGSTVRDNEAFVNVVRLWGSALDAEVLTNNEITGRDHVMRFVKFFKENIDGMRDCYLMDSASQIGIRETRRFTGDYILSEEDLINEKIFDDSIAMGGHIIDIHAPDGTSEQRRDAVPAYQIPYRCLVPKKIENLIVAGRTVSTTHVAHASIRVMGTCMGIGQGAGVAAALAAKGDGVARHVNTEDLRSCLKDLGAVTE